VPQEVPFRQGEPLKASLQEGSLQEGALQEGALQEGALEKGLAELLKARGFPAAAPVQPQDSQL
jgi:hypothetical protein